MQHVRTLDPTRIGERPEWLVGGAGADGCGVRASRLAPATDLSDLVVCGADRLLFVVDGRVGVRLGEHRVEADERSVVLVKAGTPHCTWGAGGAALILDVFAPAWPEDGLLPDVGVRHADSAGAVRRPDPSKFEGEGFAAQTLADRRTGSEHIKLNLLRVAPGCGSPDWHIHAFDQCYFILEGEMHIDIGKARVIAPKLSFVVLPAGVVHRNWNPGPQVESHISVLVPEPLPGEIFDYAVDIRDHEAQLLREIPAS